MNTGPDPTTIQLTDEQQAIVAHDHGPAVVFAVAGSGKTTAMVHRIERLVRERVFAPDRILATSFSNATVDDLETALGAWRHCRAVDVRTIHSLGYRLLQAAPPGERPLRPSLGRGGPSIEGADHEVLTEAIRQARANDVSYKDDLEDLDRQDFLSYVTDCKGNLRYADLDGAKLPEAALEVASQAPRPRGFAYYLDLYRLYEQVRHRMERVTYDDLLVGAWEALHRYPALRERAQGWFDCVVVDEYQDINLAQHEILDVLAAPSHDYMVIGDDDQTIYEWRGASPSFILDFEDEYDATTYRIQDNFRCQGPQVALANRVIEHNRRRVEKRLNLTLGFDGDLTVQAHPSELALAKAVVRQVQVAQAGGLRLADVTVLLRVYAQSAYIEHLLIERGLPYDLVGSVPFYERSEVETLLAYVRLAQWEASVLGDRGATPPPAPELPDLLVRVANQADEARYIRHAVAREAGEHAARTGTTIQQALAERAQQQPVYMAQGMRDLASQIAWLSRGLKRNQPDAVLDTFDKRIGYRTHLRESSGFDETGEGRARNVTAFIDYAGNTNHLNHLVTHLDKLRKTRQKAQRRGDHLDIRTIHRAKGLEWPVVILPHLNDGTLPFSRALEEGGGRIEEERRLLYVALTRSKRDTHLHLLEDEPTSRFLEQADHEATLADVRTVARLLEQNPRSWSAQEAVDLVHHVHALGLERYLRRWWPAPEARKRSVARTAATLLRQAESEGVIDRFRLTAQERALWEQDLGELGSLPEKGLGIPVAPLVNELPRTPTRHRAGAGTGSDRATRAQLIPWEERDLIHKLHRGVAVHHPRHGEGTVLTKKVFRGKKSVLVEFESGERRTIDLNEEGLAIIGGTEQRKQADEDGVKGQKGGLAKQNTSQIYLGKGASTKGWIRLPKAIIEEEIVPIILENEDEEESGDIIYMNFGKDVSLSGWKKVDAEAVRGQVEPIVKEHRIDGS